MPLDNEAFDSVAQIRHLDEQRHAWLAYLVADHDSLASLVPPVEVERAEVHENPRELQPVGVEKAKSGGRSLRWSGGYVWNRLRMYLRDTQHAGISVEVKQKSPGRLGLSKGESGGEDNG